MLKNGAASPNSVDPLAPDGHPFEFTKLQNKSGMTVTFMNGGNLVIGHITAEKW